MSKDIDQTARRIVDQEVCYCVSSLATELIRGAFEPSALITEDEALSLSGTEPSLDDYRDQLDSDYICEQGIDPSDGQEAWRWYDKTRGDAPELAESDWFETELEALQDCYDSECLDATGQEALEHWLVTDWMANQLRKEGETVTELESLSLTIWARATSGQAIYSDGVMQRIAARLNA